MTKIKNISVEQGYRLTLELADGRSVQVDFSDRLDTVRFGRFRDEGFFGEVVTDGEVLCWGSEVEVSIGEAIQINKNQGKG